MSTLFSCKSCTKNFTSAEGLKKHIRTAHGSKTLKSTCSVCSITFYNSKSLFKHKKSTQHYVIDDVILPVEKKIPCQYCNFQTNNQTHYFAHFKANHSTLTPPKNPFSKNSFLFLQQVYRCPFDLCHMSTFSKHAMRYHFQRIHASPEIFLEYLDKYAFALCKKCNKKIKNVDYKSHISSCLWKCQR